MPGFTVLGGGPNFVDTGQGASDRLASWGAWGADPSPMVTPETSNILRQDDNYGTIPLGQGGCGTWSPILDGSSNGATSGGDNPFYLNINPPVEGTLTDDGGVVISDFVGFPDSDAGLPAGGFFSNGGEIDIAALAVPPDPLAEPIFFIDFQTNASGLIAVGGADLPLTSGPVGSGILWNNGGDIGVQGVLSIS